MKTIFSRNEVKFLITAQQKQMLTDTLQQRFQPDKYGKSTVCSLYYDTPDFALIRRSLEHPVYKEKFRLRQYLREQSDGYVFAEIKKKYNSVVYKRRERFPFETALFLCESGFKNPESLTQGEMEQLFLRYENLRPAMCIFYNREGYFQKDGEDLRITFDTDILYRTDGFADKDSVYGKSVISEDKCVMEIKSLYSVPLWLCKTLSESGIYKTSFSKYGTAYTDYIKGVAKNA